MDVSGADGSLGRAQAAQRAATQAEQDANERIRIAAQKVRQAEQEAQARLSAVKDEYSRDYENEVTKEGTAVESAQAKGYEQLRNLQRNQAKNYSETETKGQEQLDAERQYIQHAVYTQDKENQQKLDDLEYKSFVAMNARDKELKAEYEFADTEKTKRLDQIKAEYETLVADENRIRKAEMEKMRNDHTSSLATQRGRFDAQFKQTLDDDQNQILTTRHMANQQLNELRADYTQKLDAYSARATDPFYRPIQLGASLTETEDSYVLKAHIPEHERQNLSVTIAGDEVILTGQRRSQEKQQPEPGHKVVTSSFQTFSESFPLRLPVDSKLVTREFQGDTFVVVLPKKGIYSKPIQRPIPERTRLERPDFPMNLPLAGQNADHRVEEGTPEEEATLHKRSSHTLG